ncbi:tRNA-specific adenosine deaminase subunit tad3 [Ceratocystis fimbriata CBS 114723]|uniref:tRNA-specific adenosine deaminase subunit tad3 n=1 Tax=Ceratocystis fimbriata CBS 114723 TaxID=1035309 RepID=A0A2C5XE66_9PEZI|nr:tRNA-specific adenosine deaminase subunit tad3 [Ceratocystis fimbriata CBS 114723]
MDAGPASSGPSPAGSLVAQTTASATATKATCDTIEGTIDDGFSTAKDSPSISADGDDQPPEDDENKDEERRIQNGHYDRAEPPKPCEIIHNRLTQALADAKPQPGVLVPQKTTLEVHQNHAVLNVWITRVPAKCTNSTLQAFKELLGSDTLPYLLHLRRCAKPGDLPSHLKTKFMNESIAGRLSHTGKSNFMYIIVGECERIEQSKLVYKLGQVPGVEEAFVASVTVPEYPPTSQVQAALWSSQFWPTVYRKNNPLGPHPSLVTRATQEIRSDAVIWMNLAHKVARGAYESGAGEPMGAVIVWRDNGKAMAVGIAGDARWRNLPIRNERGNCMAHSAMRAISMVAQKLVRIERAAKGLEPLERDLAFDPFADQPFLPEEKVIFEDEHPTPNGYLCHGLELYTTHEPCIQCSMAILHSRMGKVIYCNRMPLTGGMCAEDRSHGHPELKKEQNGAGLGLFWRKELNWSLLCWEWECPNDLEPLPKLAHDIEG